MISNTRTEYSARNTAAASISRILAILVGFATRVVFIHTLSESYVGINGLFTDILNILALSELGIDTAITFALYRPIAEGNIEEQKSIMRLYCWFYRLVAAIVFVLGLLLVPFLPMLIKNPPEVKHFLLIYLLYLIGSVISYLKIYKKTLIDAHQMMYVGTIYQTISYMLQDALQIVVLLVTKNFILYILIHIVATLFGNLWISSKANRLYPYLKDKDVKPLNLQKRKDIIKNIWAMFLHKIGAVVVNNTDNLLLSSFVGITSVAYYSNYFLIIGSIRQIVDQIFEGIAASVGNLGVTEAKEKVYEIFQTAFFIGQWLYGFSAICLYELLNPFIALSFGQNYVFAQTIVLVLCLNFFINGMRKATLVFRNSLGLFWFDRYKSILEAGINLIASIILVRHFGTMGVFLGTLISTILTSSWVEPYILYKHRLLIPFSDYIKKYITYFGVVGAIWFFTDILCRIVDQSGLVLLILRFCICMIVPNSILFVCYGRKKETKLLFQKIRYIHKRGNKRP